MYAIRSYYELGEGGVGGGQGLGYLRLAVGQGEEAGLEGAGGQVDAGLQHQVVEALEGGQIAGGHLLEAADVGLAAEERNNFV